MGQRNGTRLMVIGMTTALTMASGCGHSDVDKAIHGNDQGALNDILKDKTLLNEPDRQGYPPLVYAAREGRPAAVQTLLRDGADVEATDKKGSTALAYAADHNYIAIAQMLLDAKANPNHANVAGRTPLSFAEDGNHIDMVNLLKAHGAHN